jgi:flagellar protein FliO/FliZ
MTRRTLVHPRLVGALDRLRGGRRTPWLAAVALLVLTGMAGLLGSATTAPSLSLTDAVVSPAAEAGGALGTGDMPSLVDLAGKGLLVLALLLITMRVLRRFSSAGRSGPARMVVLESRPLAQRATLHLVAIGERRLVIGLTPSGLVSLAELGADELPEQAPDVDAVGGAPAADPTASQPTHRFVRVLADLAGRWSVGR